MKYKVGDKVRVRKDLVVNSCYGKEDFVREMKSFIGKIVTISKVIDGEYMILEDDGDYAWTEEMFEGLANEAPSIVKRINDKHNILNGLLNSDGSVDGEKLMEKLEDRQMQIANGVLMRDRPQRPTTPASTGREGKFKVGDIVQFVRTMSLPSGGYIKRGTVWEIAALNDTRYTLLLVDGEEGVKGIGYNINSSLDTINSYCEKVEAKGNDSEEAKTKGSHYERASAEQFEGLDDENINGNTIRPGYYQSIMGDVFDIANAYRLDMACGTAVKYILRAGKKDKSKEIEDLQKAIRSIERAIELRGGKNGTGENTI